MDRTHRPGLSPRARLRWDGREKKYLLVYPERGLLLDRTAAEIVLRCDGVRTVGAIAGELAEERAAPLEVVERDVIAFLEQLSARALLVEGGGPLQRIDAATQAHSLEVEGAPRPYTLIAEVTYRCPLRCAYCSNPVDLERHRDEMSTEDWRRVIREAAELGVVQLHLTGGEPLARRDLEALVEEGRRNGLYVNLITSGVPLSRERLHGLVAAGLDALQLSVQGDDVEGTKRIADVDVFDAKLRAAEWICAEGLPLTLNVVLHRENLDRVDALVALAESMGADRLELANTQYLGWALRNRGRLMPSREQLDRARERASAARERLRGTMEILFVLPDYFSDRPRACMDGWARRFVHMTPDGTVLPCHAAMMIPHLEFQSVRGGASLLDVWRDSPSLNAFRGNEWMKEPCRSCERKDIDFGGCRCQAFALAGDAAVADPACSLSPAHAVVENARRATDTERTFVFRGLRS